VSKIATKHIASRLGWCGDIGRYWHIYEGATRGDEELHSVGASIYINNDSLEAVVGANARKSTDEQCEYNDDSIIYLEAKDGEGRGSMDYAQGGSNYKARN